MAGDGPPDQSSGSQHHLGPDVGRRIRRARRERRMTLGDLGGAELSRSFLSLVETGKSRISLRALVIVARNLGVPLSYFFEDDSLERTMEGELFLDRAEAAMRRDNPTGCLRLLAESSIPDSLAGRTLWLRGWALLELSCLEEAIPPLRQAVEITDREGDPRRIAEARYHLVLALTRKNCHRDALDYLHPALLRAAEVDDSILVGALTSLLGHLSLLQRDPDSARHHFDCAREHFDRGSDLNALAGSYFELSSAFRAGNDLPSALRYSRLAVGIHEARSWIQRAVQEMNTLALRYLEAGERTAARETSEASIARAEAGTDADTRARTHTTHAAIIFRLGDVEAARAEASTVARIGAGITAITRAESWIILARIAEAEGRHERADKLYLNALAVLDKQGQELHFADAALAYSWMLRDRGDLAGAFKYSDIVSRQRPASGLARTL
jgi:transcriptional regulator with XRE-family HTH domain/Tfp pilus assembly protein PilF